MTVWPNLAKFNIFDKILKVLGNILSVHLVLGYILNLALQILYAIGQIFIYTNSQILKK